MLRKFISLGPRGCQIVGSNFRSCQLVTQVPCQNYDSPSHGKFINDKTKTNLAKHSKHLQTSQGELKYAENLINSWIFGAKVSPENRLKSILEFCNSKNDETYKNNIGERIYMWCTGILAVSSLLLCRSWLETEPQKKRTLKWLDPETVQNVIKNYFWGIPRDHLLLSVKATANDEARSKVKDGSPLDSAAEKLKIASIECTGSILNKLGLQMLAAGQQEQAAELFGKAAQNGHTAAIYNMGLCFDNGKGVLQDHVKAAEFYTVAAERGHPRAQFNLATLYAEGTGGLKKDVGKALTMLELAADNSITKAQVLMGFHFAKKGNHNKAAKYLEMASKAKDPVAMYHFGICLENGIGRQKDIEKAGHLYEEAAEIGHISAMYNIAVFYEKGLGDFTKSRSKAMYWFEKGAENGDKMAEAKLEQLRQTNVSTAYKMHPILRDIFMWNLLNKQERKRDIHKSKSTPNLQRTSQIKHPETKTSMSKEIVFPFDQSETSFSRSFSQMSSATSSYSDLSLAIM